MNQLTPALEKLMIEYKMTEFEKTLKVKVHNVSIYYKRDGTALTGRIQIALSDPVAENMSRKREPLPKKLPETYQISPELRQDILEAVEAELSQQRKLIEVSSENH